MNTKLTLSALLIAALPLAAQAHDNASERALQLNQQPLSAPSHQASNVQVDVDQANGDSWAMKEARASLPSHSDETHIDVSGDPLTLAKQATS
ncbi:hypothetical protein CVH10_14005 [Halomonas sp. ND22Bw]|uniref:hypothetical protein n=1 Tax=Halomonas sp. ND22Bw TaxID=2054178 RepID=UPI000D0B9343|nr:hypothetical protein CVH10_14005 [Halomonas sp. ND22Bw]